MSGFDIDAALRVLRRLPQTTRARRADDALPFMSDKAEAGSALLLDTCVYIDTLQHRAPAALVDLCALRVVHHSTVAIQEMMHGVGALDPRHPGTASAIDSIRTLIAAMPAHRIVTPDADILGRAALLSGVLCRIQGYRHDARLRALNDCTLFLQAQKLGLTVLTANLADFDALMQLLPGSRVLFYRAGA